MELKLNGTVYGFKSNQISTITFEINGRCLNEVSGDCDIYVGFGNTNQYFSTLIAMDSGGLTFSVYDEVYMLSSVQCGNNLNNGDITNILRATGPRNRNPLGASNGWYNISDKMRPNGDNVKIYSITLSIMNDDMLGESEFIWSETNRTISCNFNNTFNVNEDLYLQIGSDGTSIHDQQAIYNIHITTENSQPTSQPTTSFPTTSNPTTSIPTTVNPTNNPTEEPSTDPSIAPTEQPTTNPTTSFPTTSIPTTFNPTTSIPTTANPTDNPTNYPTPDGTEGIFIFLVCFEFVKLSFEH